jgi:hypothetical protein
MTQMYEVGLQKVTSAAAGPIVTLVAPSTSRPDIREIGVFMSSTPASGPTIGLGRPAAVGSGTLTGSLGQATEPADPAATCTLVSSFGTSQPTAPSIFMRRLSLPASVGAGIIWTWDRNMLAVAQSGNLVLWQLTALAVTYDVYWVWEE